MDKAERLFYKLAGEQSPTSVETHTGVGSALGAGVGALVAGKHKALGAVVGAAVGGVAGNVAGKLENKNYKENPGKWRANNELAASSGAMMAMM